MVSFYENRGGERPNMPNIKSLYLVEGTFSSFGKNTTEDRKMELHGDFMIY